MASRARNTGTIRTAKAALRELHAGATPTRAKALARFFKTGPGEYGEGDRFLGLTMPQVRAIAARATLALEEADALLDSEWHEARMLALLCLVNLYDRGDEERRRAVYETYLRRTDRIDNWDLVDVSVEGVVGRHLLERSREPLYTLARSASIWERRIAMIATFAFIKRGEGKPALRIAEMLLGDDHDLLHKAAGWMLREVGKRCSKAELVAFLDEHAGSMPRTMLRYAIERFPATERRRWMAVRHGTTARVRAGRGRRSVTAR